LRALLLAALDDLSPEQREVFVLHEIEELSIPEVAEALSCPLQTAYSRLSSARTRIRARIGNWTR
jgi:RNA polymerase sigma-70 factor (ECF subfamily)